MRSMIFRANLVCFGLTSWMLFACACANDQELSPQYRFCQATCDHYARCSVSVSDGCERACVKDISARDRYRDQVLELTADCLDQAGCPMLEDDEPVDSCFDQAAAEADPSPTLVNFCDALSPVWFDCGYRADKLRCVDSWSRYSDEFLARGISCALDSCEEMDQCMSDLFQ